MDLNQSKLSKSEWETIEKGIQQRSEVLNLLLKNIIKAMEKKIYNKL